MHAPIVKAEGRVTLISDNTKATVKLTTFPNEPLARVAVGRLRQNGIGSIVRSMGAGPGGWGTAATLPHAMYVLEADEMEARQTLDLPTVEIEERDDSSKTRRWSRSVLMGVALLVAICLVSGYTAMVIQ